MADRNSQPVIQSDTAKAGATSAATSTTSSTVVASNPQRVEVTICNDDATNIVYLGLGTTAIASKGVRLNAAGGSYTTQAFTGAINAVAAAGTPTLTIVEI